MNFNTLVKNWEDQTLNHYLDSWSESDNEELYFDQLSPEAQEEYLASLAD